MSAPSREEALRDHGRWLRGLCDLAHGWVGAPVHQSAQTAAYVDLIFAFGMARLRAVDYGRELHARAEQNLSQQDEAHRYLLQAYTYRIRQAFDGAPGGPLPASLLESLEPMERLLQYVVDRLRKHSSILEPELRTNPYRNWGARLSKFERAIGELTQLREPYLIIQAVAALLESPQWRGDRDEAHLRVLIQALNLPQAP